MDIYRQEILDHFKNPRNFGDVSKMDRVAEEINASCGDRIKLGVKLKKFEVTNLEYISEVCFSGEGCAVCMAATSMLTEMLKNKSLKEAMKIDQKKMIEQLGIKISSARIKCATLGLEVWQKLQKNLI
ncbi:iron-sulfur cluster assembly scaffold protein [Candidatus Peregrinibacteria bacterium]|jgi:nitrogen fixation protein NifU and related proteins|nr:iron-sulfur cluster assembly scaffold protein [Candidatus Peregrinibacteria bacterium]